MPSISKELLKSLDKYVDEFKRHPFIASYPYPADRRPMIYKRFYVHLTNASDRYDYLWKRAAEFAPTPEAKEYVLKVFNKAEESHQDTLKMLSDEFKDHPAKDTECDPIAMEFTLQMNEWELVLNKKDLALFLASHLGPWKFAAVMLESYGNDIKLDFDDCYDIDVMAQWIDRLAPKEWDQKYFEELRNACLKLIAIELPAKYDYFYYGLNLMPRMGYVLPTFD